MQTRIRISLLAVLSILIFASCTKTNKQGKFIPKNASVVLHIDGASLSSKLPWDEVKQNAMFKEMYADSSIPAFVRRTLDNPESSGIDVKNDLLLFVQADTTGSYTAFTGSIKDAEKFRVFNLDASEGGSESEKGDIKFISKSPMCVGWNKEKFVYIVNTENAYPQDMKPTKARDLMATCQQIFNLEESNSLAKDEKFTALVKKAGDLHFWLNTAELSKKGMPNSPLAMLNISKMYEGNITAGTVNFEAGKIALDIKSYAGKELSDLYKKYSDKNIDEEMIKSIPTKDVAAIFAMSFKPEGIKELLKLLGVEGLANIGLSRMGVDFTLDDFIKANKGDILIAITNLNRKPLSDSTVATKESGSFLEPDFMFAASINDKTAFNQLIRAGEKLTAPFKIDSTQSGFLDKFSYNSSEKYFAIGNSKENVDKFIAGSNKNNFDFLSKLKDNSFGGYINFQFIMKSFESSLPADTTMKAAYDASLKMWDNAYIKGGKFEDGGISQNWEINLIDKNTNSLKQLNSYFGLLGKIKIENDKRTKTILYEENSTIHPPVPGIDSVKNK